MTRAECDDSTAHREQFHALSRLLGAFEDQGADPEAIIAMMQNRINTIRQELRSDVIEDMADTLNTDREYRYSVASQLVQKMSSVELASYRADYLNYNVEDNHDLEQ